MADIEDLIERLDDEAMRLHGRGIDRGCVDSSLAGNLALEVSAALSAQQREIAELRERLTSLHNALTPSAETKAAYIGEFKFGVELAHPRLGSELRSIVVPWTTVKEIMAAIIGHAALNTPSQEGEKR